MFEDAARGSSSVAWREKNKKSKNVRGVVGAVDVARNPPHTLASASETTLIF